MLLQLTGYSALYPSADNSPPIWDLVKGGIGGNMGEAKRQRGKFVQDVTKKVFSGFYGMVYSWNTLQAANPWFQTSPPLVAVISGVDEQASKCKHDMGCICNDVQLA